MDIKAVDGWTMMPVVIEDHPGTNLTDYNVVETEDFINMSSVMSELSKTGLCADANS